MERVIMIHEINDKIIQELNNIVKPNDILTFDDGLYSQYKYLEDLLRFNNKKIFFISTGLIRDENINPNLDFITSKEAHDQVKNFGVITKKDIINQNINLVPETLNNFMSLKEIRKINSYPNCSIGLHGHLHLDTRYKSIKILNMVDFPVSGAETIKIVSKDTNISLEKYFQLFQKFPESKNGYCYPYNYIPKIISIQNIMKKYNEDCKVYGPERYDINHNLNIKD